MNILRRFFLFLAGIDAHTMTLRPDDVLLFIIRRHVSSSEMRYLTDRVKAIVGNGVKVIVVDNDTDVRVVHKLPLAGDDAHA